MEALAILKILLIVFVLGSTLYSVIVYQGRKKSSLKSLTAFRRDAVAARKLDPTEQRLVDTLLEQTDRKTVGRLTGDDVYPLSGNYLRHGLETNGNTVWHDTIGGVEVLLPYDAEYFLREHNDALVVLADKQAIVIALNEDFDLAGAVDREQRREQKQNQWDSGEYGELSSVFRDPDEPEDREGPSLTIREQRDETPAEVEARRGRGIALMPAFLWTLTFAFLGIAMAVETPLFTGICLLTSLACALLALFLFFRRRSLGDPLKVNQVSGQVRLTPVAVDEFDNVRISVTLNESIGFELPHHWRPFITYEDGQHQEMAIRVDDYSVVSYGNRMSLDEEVRRFPPVYWGRHLTLAIIAGIALLYPLSSVTQLSRDILFAGQWLRGADTVTLTTPQQIRTQPPSPGMAVQIDGNGHCAIEQGGYSPRFNCRHIYWGADAPQSSHTQASEVSLRLQDNTLLKTEKDSYLTLLAITKGWNTYQNGTPVIFTNLPGIIDTVDAACDAGDGSRDVERQCRHIHRFFLERLAFTLDTRPETWSALRADVQARQHSDAPVHAITGENLVNKLAAYLRQLVNALNADRSQDIARDIANSQQGGVMIRLSQGRVPDSLQQANRYDGSTMLNALLAMIDDPEGKPFSLQGMVTAYEKNNDTTPELSLDLTRTASNAKDSLIMVVWLLIATTMLIGHGVMTVIRFRQRTNRDKAVAALYA
ncbi:MAG: IgaA/UmoB family intracellular growth attenuator [Pseudomonadota bacterium]|nr:IgaA/UmoB family intracellular growth attenuator [Pseudomonadota bacterium]